MHLSTSYSNQVSGRFELPSWIMKKALRDGSLAGVAQQIHGESGIEAKQV